MKYDDFVLKAAIYQATKSLENDDEDDYENGEWNGRADALIWAAKELYPEKESVVMRDLQFAYDKAVKQLGKEN